MAPFKETTSVKQLMPERRQISPADYDFGIYFLATIILIQFLSLLLVALT